MQKIINRKKKNISVLVENETGKNGLVFIAHGLAGTYNQPHIQKFAEAFLEDDYIVVRHDATNSVGLSDGDLQEATLTNYYEDFEDVIGWASSQPWYQEPFVVAGHSLGGACNLMFASNYPEKVKALAPTSAFLSGEITFESLGKELMEKWESDGYRLEKSNSRPGLVKRFNWTLAEDLLKHHLVEKAHFINVPTLLIVGEKDVLTPLSSQQDLYNNISSNKKELHIIKDSSHTFMEERHLEEVKNIFKQWIGKI